MSSENIHSSSGSAQEKERPDETGGLIFILKVTLIEMTI
jgi:hypothetical protein